MKMKLMALGMMAAAYAFGGVYDDCVYLFEGGLDADGNGQAATGEIRDELHAGPSHAHNLATVVGYADGATFRNEPVPYQSAGLSTQNVQCLHFAHPRKVSGTTTNFFPNIVKMPFIADACPTNVYTGVFRVRLDRDPLGNAGAWLMNFGYTKNTGGQGLLFGFAWNASSNAYQMSTHSTGSTGKSFGIADIPTNTWFDVAVVVTGNVITVYRAFTGRGSPRSGTTAALDDIYSWLATASNTSTPFPNLTMARANTWMGAQSGLTSVQNFTTISDTNAKKYFCGSVRRFAVWNRALTAEDVREAFGRPRPDIVRIGAANGNSDEFASDATATATVDAMGSWRDLPASLRAGDVRNVTFPLSANEADMPQLLRIKTLAGGGAGTLRVSLNGTAVASKLLAAGQTFVATLPARAFVTGANTLTLARTDANGAAVALDSLAIGGSWQVGKNNNSDAEFTYGVVLTGWDSYVNTFAWNRAANAKENGTQTLNLYVTVPEEAVSRYGYHYETRIRNSYALSTTPNTKVTISANGVTKKEISGIAGSVWSDVIPIEFEPGELHAGVNNIRLTVTGGGCDYFDYHRFQLVPPADGTYIIVK
ncbi:MAG: hypothetical protein IJI36_13505 [Kiritimatiellae bacterium]|nr:hypothetical protein [Kiritimatiellia bacterium]